MFVPHIRFPCAERAPTLCHVTADKRFAEARGQIQLSNRQRRAELYRSKFVSAEVMAPRYRLLPPAYPPPFSLPPILPPFSLPPILSSSRSSRGPLPPPSRPPSHPCPLASFPPCALPSFAPPLACTLLFLHTPPCLRFALPARCLLSPGRCELRELCIPSLIHDGCHRRGADSRGERRVHAPTRECSGEAQPYLLLPRPAQPPGANSSFTPLVYPRSISGAQPPPCLPCPLSTCRRRRTTT